MQGALLVVSQISPHNIPFHSARRPNDPGRAPKMLRSRDRFRERSPSSATRNVVHSRTAK